VHRKISVALVKGNHGIFRARIQLYTWVSGHARVPGHLVPTAESKRAFYELYVSCFELCVYSIQFCFLFVHFPSSLFCLPFDVTAICHSLPHSVGNTYDMSSPSKMCLHCCLLFSTEDGGPYSLHCSLYPVASHSHCRYGDAQFLLDRCATRAILVFPRLLFPL
jgi:hypothetical protein